MSETTNRVVISVLVDNQPNVLSRVVSLFGRRGFNIDSLTVSATNDPALSRITVVFSSTPRSVQQLLTQTEKLEVVREVFTLDNSDSLFRELLLIKLKASEEERTALKEIVDIYRGKIIDLKKDSLIIELTGEPAKMDAFLDMVDGYEILEVCRTGMTAMGRGIRENWNVNA